MGSFHSIGAQTLNDTLKVGYTNVPPFIIEEDGELKGINIWLWETLAKDLDLNFEIVEMGFAEMIDSLKQDQLDVSINPLTITSSRNESILFTAAYFASNSCVVVAEQSSIGKTNGIKLF